MLTRAIGCGLLHFASVPNRRLLKLLQVDTNSTSGIDHLMHLTRHFILGALTAFTSLSALAKDEVGLAEKAAGKAWENAPEEKKAL